VDGEGWGGRVLIQMCMERVENGSGREGNRSFRKKRKPYVMERLGLSLHTTQWVVDFRWAWIVSIFFPASSKLGQKVRNLNVNPI
jgi:hypothetical protein